MRRRIGIIGGSGLYKWSNAGELLELETPYGDVLVTLHRSTDFDVFFVPRHGPTHATPPHKVNSRAEVAAMKACRVDALLGIFNVGALDTSLESGTWVAWTDLLDATKDRVTTFSDDQVVHVDLVPPYCPARRTDLVKAAPRNTMATGVYVAVEGPRFETATEAAMYRNAGGTIIGMTAVPEVILAREAGLCYVPVAMVANAVGESVPLVKLQQRMTTARPTLRSWVARWAKAWRPRAKCDCETKARNAVLLGVP